MIAKYKSSLNEHQINDDITFMDHVNDIGVYLGRHILFI